jgi:hypothetical protein
LTVPVKVAEVVPAPLADPVDAVGADIELDASTPGVLPPVPLVLPEPVTDDVPELLDDVEAGHPRAWSAA